MVCSLLTEFHICGIVHIEKRKMPIWSRAKNCRVELRFFRIEIRIEIIRDRPRFS